MLSTHVGGAGLHDGGGQNVHPPTRQPGPVGARTTGTHHDSKESTVNTSRRPAAALTLGGLATLSCLLVAPPGAQALATACSITPAATDYNGDGFDDAAIGDPEATVDGVRRAGAVTVLLGDADGRIGEGSARTVVTRASFGETPVAGDRFGHDVALAVTGRNGRCADLLVGSPGVDVGRSADAGTVHLISDLPDVEGTPQLQALPLTQVAVGGDVEAGDQFGHALSWSGPDPQGRSTLLVGAPGEDVGAATDAGSVSVHRLQGGDLQGLAELRQGRGLPGTAQTGDRLGQALAAGLVGAPGDTVSGRRGAGSVTLLRGPGRPALQLSQSTAGVPGTAEVADGFGASVAVEPASGTLAVGSPGEDAAGPAARARSPSSTRRARRCYRAGRSTRPPRACPVRTRRATTSAPPWPSGTTPGRCWSASPARTSGGSGTRAPCSRSPSGAAGLCGSRRRSPRTLRGRPARWAPTTASGRPSARCPAALRTS